MLSGKKLRENPTFNPQLTTSELNEIGNYFRSLKKEAWAH
jgi:hypothetical protein